VRPRAVWPPIWMLTGVEFVLSGIIFVSFLFLLFFFFLFACLNCTLCVRVGLIYPFFEIVQELDGKVSSRDMLGPSLTSILSNSSDITNHDVVLQCCGCSKRPSL